VSITLDVIVRTLADASRSKLLFRALDSIQSRSGVKARPIVVVNGQRFDAATLAALKSRPGILLHHEQQASAGLALVAGRKLVTAPFFSYLDDDDELIAGSLTGPMRWLESHPDCDVLINNGYFVKDGGALVESTHIASHIAQPAVSLLDECWLSPGACIFRTAGVPSDLLNADWSHLEWTRMAFELCAQRKRLHLMDVKTVRYNDTPGSLSKQLQHQEAALALLREVRRDKRLHPVVRRGAYRKYLRTLHNLATSNWKHGRVGHAWRCHFESLRPPYTFKYLLFSRKLLWPFGSEFNSEVHHPKR
jgi:hypothetical protein